MSANTKIQWCEATWNPIAGCSIVSPGCHNCYAMRTAARLEAMGQKKYAGTTKKTNGKTIWTGKVNLDNDALSIPLRTRKPTTYFVNSMSDLFHEDVPDEFIAAVFGVMAASPKHTFQVLTKRAERMHDWTRKMNAAGGLGVYIRSNQGRDALRGLFSAVSKLETVNGELQRAIDDPWMQVMNGAACNFGTSPLFNVWLGVSCEDQKRADERIPWLLKTPAAVRFISAEPLLGELDICGFMHDSICFKTLDDIGCICSDPREVHLDWVIVGGESGHGARPCYLAWIRSIVEQCKDAGVSCFVKQIGSRSEEWDSSRRPNNIGPFYGNGVKDKKGGDPTEWPEDLRVRQMPEGRG